VANIDPSKIEALLQQLWEAKATDLLITAGAPPLCRVDGQMAPLEGMAPLTAADTEELIVGCLGTSAAAQLKAEKELDFSFNWKDRVRYRGNAFFQRNTMALALRVIPLEIPTLEELGVPDQVKQFLTRAQGLVLVTGPTGSGKSTTLAAMIGWINENRACHVVTIEDPIEYVHTHKMSAINQREVGGDTRSFERALRSALREDPDVLLVGEMRDQDSIQTALTIAETGHLVFATLHTNDTATALDRLVDVFPTDRQDQIRVQLSSTLLGVIAQRLVPKVDTGMVAAFEIMFANHAVRNLVREGRTTQIRNVILTGYREGMQTLEMDLSRLVAQGVITAEDAESRAVLPREVRAASSANLALVGNGPVGTFMPPGEAPGEHFPNQKE
jgi:twitching motility protein PilT